MQTAQLYSLGLYLMPVKKFETSTSVEFNGSLNEFVTRATERLPTMVFLKGKSVAEIMIGILTANGRYGYTPDMVDKLFSAMLVLSALESHKMQLPQMAIDEIKHLRASSCVQSEIAEYQLAMPVDGVLVLSPVFSNLWIQFFDLYYQDIAAQYSKDRILCISNHNEHLKQKPTASLQCCA